MSLTLHVVLLGALAAWYLGQRNAAHRAAIQVTAAAASAATAKNEAGASQSLPSPSISPQQIAATLEHAEAKSSAATTAEQLAELEKQAARLERVADKKSVDEIAGKFREWTPTPARATEPAAASVAGEFDFDTAQIHDVLRTATEDGQWNYRSVLIDAAGQTFEVDIDREQGEKTYATFESLKKFPLANQVYRQIAMSLIDRALQNRRAVEPPTTSTNTTPTEIEVDDRDPFDDSGSQ